MSQIQELQECIDLLAEKHVPALRGAKATAFGRIFEVWVSPQVALVVGSYQTVLLWLGCVALTKRIYPYPQYEPRIVMMVIRSAERMGVL